MIMVAFVEVLVVWSRFWRIYERGFVDLVEGTTKRMALMFGRKTILVKILFWKRVLLLLLDYHGKLYFKLVEIIIRNANPSKQEIKRFPIPSVIHSARTSSPIINYPSNTNTKKRKERKIHNESKTSSSQPANRFEKFRARQHNHRDIQSNQTPHHQSFVSALPRCRNHRLSAHAKTRPTEKKSATESELR